MKLKLGDKLYTYELNQIQESEGRTKLDCEPKIAEIIGISKRTFEGRWTDEDKCETILYKVKIEGLEYITSNFLIENPDEDTNYSFFVSEAKMKDYIGKQLAFLYYDGRIDENNYLVP